MGYDSDTVLLDAEPDDMYEGIQVNYFLLCFAPLTILLVKVFGRLAVWISQFFFLPSEEEQKKIIESSHIKKQMNALSVVDDFAAYSKLQRKHNLIMLNLEADALSRKSLRNDLARMIRSGFYFVTGATYVFILFWHGTKDPVLILPSDLFFPLNYFLSYPTGIPGAVSLPVWTLLVRTLISIISS